jgi:hypothetical protein
VSSDYDGLLERLDPAFANALLERGLARNLVWRNGVHDRTPRFGASLTGDLLDYGVGMLIYAIKLRKDQGPPEWALRAFDRSAQAIESAVRDGSPTDPSGAFYSIIAAAAYSLAGYNARAYIMVRDASDNLSEIESLFSAFMLRRFDIVRARIRTLHEVVDARSEDEYLQMEGAALVSEALQLNYFLALAAALSYFGRGDAERLEVAKHRLRTGATHAANLGDDPTWLLYELTSLLVEDIDTYSYHAVLKPHETEPALRALSDRFIYGLSTLPNAQVELWPSQTVAARSAFRDDDDLVLSMPTSAGKTRIAQLAMLRTLAAGKEVIYVTPLRALCAQIESDLASIFESLGYSVSRLYRRASNPLGAARDEIRVTTPERLDFELRRDGNLLEHVGLIVLDEAHLIGTSTREVRYELLIERIRRNHSSGDIRFVCLSALLEGRDDLRTFTQWISRDRSDTPLTTTWRPTRQSFGTITWIHDHARLDLEIGAERPSIERLVTQRPVPGLPRERRLRIYPDSNWRLVIDSAIALAREDESVLIYCPEKRSVLAGADVIVDYIQRGLIPQTLLHPDALSKEELSQLLEWLGANHDVTICLRHGLAIHHGALPDEVLAISERLIRDRRARLIIASPSVAQGINVSASTLIFQALGRYNPTDNRHEDIDAEEFRNVIGRAGRAFVDINGRIIYCLGVDGSAEDRYARWDALRRRASSESLDSGLLRILEFLLARAGLTSADAVDFVAAHANIDQSINTGSPIYSDADYSPEVDILDDSIVLLLGDVEIEAGDAGAWLDTLIRGSLFARGLQKRNRATAERLQAAFLGRARTIVNRFPSSNRRVSYRSGVPIRLSGAFEDLFLGLEDDLALLDTRLLTSGNLDEESISLAASVVTRAMAFPTFAYRATALGPDERLAISSAWLRGTPVSRLIEIYGDRVLPFIEEGLRYSAVWALEALRAMQNDDDAPRARRYCNLADLVGAGVPNALAAKLLRMGLRSRAAAAELGLRWGSLALDEAELLRLLIELQAQGFPNLNDEQRAAAEALVIDLNVQTDILVSEARELTFHQAVESERESHILVFSAGTAEFEVTDLDLHALGSGRHEGLKLPAGGASATLIDRGFLRLDFR